MIADDLTPESPLTQGRELKFFCAGTRHGAWPSPLTQGRELKYTQDNPVRNCLPSPLTQGRELKFVPAVKPKFLYVAPHAGA